MSRIIRFRPQLEQCESRDTPAGAFGRNMIFNGGAESGAVDPGQRGYQIVRPIPEWSPVGNFTKVQYGPESSSAGFPWIRDRPFGGAFFTGGPNNAKSSAQQIEVLSLYDLSIINRGGVEYKLSGWLGGYASQNDSATLTVRFQTGAGATLATATIGPVTAAMRANKTDFLYRESIGMVPLGTRRLHTILSMNRGSGSYNDGYADNLSLILTPRTRSTIQFAASSYTVNESARSLTVSLTRTGYVGGSGSILITTQNSTAKAGLDFTGVSRRITFAAGQTTRSFTISITDDSVREQKENLFLNLTQPLGVGVRIGLPAFITVSIVSNE